MERTYKVVIETKPQLVWIHHAVVDLRSDPPFDGFEEWMNKVDPMLTWNGPMLCAAETHDLVINAVGRGEFTTAPLITYFTQELYRAPATIGRDLLRRLIFMPMVCGVPIRVLVFRDTTE